MDTSAQDYPDDRRYTAEGVWALLDGDEATIGISAFAQDAMGEIVYVELPKVGTRMQQGECFGPIESVKAVVEPEAPLSGEVVATNDEAYQTPELVNTSPYGTYTADVEGTIEGADKKTIRITKIHVNYHVSIPADQRETFDRALAVHPAGCPAHESVKDAIEVTHSAEVEER